MIRTLRPARLAPLAVLLSLAAVDAHADICHVTTLGKPIGSGVDWSSPLDLATALATPACTEVWVAKGLYRQPAGTDVETSFRLRPDVAVYGGFAGTETLRAQRNVTANVTVSLFSHCQGCTGIRKYSSGSTLWALSSASKEARAGAPSSASRWAR